MTNSLNCLRSLPTGFWDGCFQKRRGTADVTREQAVYINGEQFCERGYVMSLSDCTHLYVTHGSHNICRSVHLSPVI
jgi:hypothetical protein